MSDEKKYEFEDSPEIEIGNNNVGTLLKVISVVLIIVCVYYFVEQFINKGDTEEKPKELPAKEAVQE